MVAVAARLFEAAGHGVERLLPTELEPPFLSLSNFSSRRSVPAPRKLQPRALILHRTAEISSR